MTHSMLVVHVGMTPMTYSMLVHFGRLNACILPCVLEYMITCMQKRHSGMHCKMHARIQHAEIQCKMHARIRGKLHTKMYGKRHATMHAEMHTEMHTKMHGKIHVKMHTKTYGQMHA